jgi:hypothetical protein
METNKMTIWHFQRLISRRLLAWASISVISGLVMYFSKNKFWRNLGAQFASWGIINAGIAVFGDVSTQNRIANIENPGTPDTLANETKKLRLILLINAGLDVFYILGGRGLAQRDKGDGAQRGHGIGIIIQGAFLLIFDIVHAVLIRDKK